MMDRLRNQNKRLTSRTESRLRPIPKRMRRRRPPGIPLAVDNGQTRVRDIVAAVLVDCVRVGGPVDAESVVAD